MSATVREIAEVSGLSIRTVSRVLRLTDSSPHKAETRERVLSAARRLGYRPNAAARAARTGRFNAIAMLLGNRQGQSYLRTGLIDGVYDVLERHDLHLTIARIPDALLTDEQSVPKLLREWMADGMLINYVYGFPPRMRELIERYTLPSIWINATRDNDCVIADNYRAAAAATQRLIDLGHRRIGLLMFDQSNGADLTRLHYAAADRWRGYAQAMEKEGLSPRHYGKSPEVSHWAHIAERMLRASDRPTAVVAATEREANATVVGAAMAGLRVPEDLSIITFTGGQAIDIGLPIDTFVLDRRELGAQATRMLLEKIERPAEKLPPRVIQFTHLPGCTVSQPGEAAHPSQRPVSSPDGGSQ